MDVKSAFVNGLIEEELYVDQPPDFVDYKHPNHVYRPQKALYGLKQAPRSCYDRLSSFLIKQSFTRGQLEKTLFIKKVNSELLIVKIYVNDIIFGATNEILCKEISSCMQKEFEMSMTGELNFFLGLQVKQMKHGTFLNQTKYCTKLIKKFGMEKCKEASTPMATLTYLDLDEKGKSVDELRYRGMIGSLLYLTKNRPYVMLSAYLCARYQANAKESHLTVVKSDGSLLVKLLWRLNLLASMRSFNGDCPPWRCNGR